MLDAPFSLLIPLKTGLRTCSCAVMTMPCPAHVKLQRALTRTMRTADSSPRTCSCRLMVYAVQTPAKLSITHANERGTVAEPAKTSRCPFAQAASFFTAERNAPSAGPKVSVLTQAGGAEHSTPHLWLEAGVPGQDKPNKLVSGLRQLTDLDEFLIELPDEMPQELELKRRAFDDPQRHLQCFAAEDSSVAAQAECLELFLEYLPQRYPELYTVQGKHDQRTVTVQPTGETHRVRDYAARPLELCCRIAQEDLVLMRHEPSVERYVMSAAGVVFSFGGLHEKVASPMALIHAPVPGFASDLDRLVAKTFNALRPEAPVWRNNWGLADSGELDNPLYGTEAAFQGVILGFGFKVSARMAAGARGHLSAAPRAAGVDAIVQARAAALRPEQRWLKTEYQTLRRLPRTQQVLFTVRTFVEPLPNLAHTPEAAAVVAASLAGMTPALRNYKGLTSEQAAQDMLDYLKGLAAAGRVDVSHLQLLTT